MPYFSLIVNAIPMLCTKLASHELATKNFRNRINVMFISIYNVGVRYAHSLKITGSGSKNRQNKCCS